MPLNFDVVIIGAGPAGSVATALLLKEDLKVCIIEKNKFPRFMIGESLLPHCMDIFTESDLLPIIKEQNYMVKTGAFFTREHQAFDLDFSEQYTHGWGYTYQVPRDHFDATLADTVAKRGTKFFYEHTPEKLSFESKGVKIQVKDPQGQSFEISARFILDGSGSGGFIPRALNLYQDAKLPPRMAIFTHVTSDKLPAGKAQGKIWICTVNKDVWMWVIPFSNGKTSVGAVGDPRYFESLPGSLDDKLRAIILTVPRLRERLSQAQFVFPARSFQDYSLAVKQLHGPHFVLLGNAAGFLDPIFSSGVTLALESASRAVKLMIREFKGERVDWQTDYQDYMLLGFKVFRAYVESWYDGTLPQIIYAPEVDDLIKRQISSVLSGYVWDKENPMVKAPKKTLQLISELLKNRR